MDHDPQRLTPDQQLMAGVTILVNAAQRVAAEDAAAHLLTAAAQSFDAVTERDGRWWVFRLPELDAVGQAHTLAEVEYEARCVAASWLDVPLDTVAVTVAEGSTGMVEPT